MTIESTNEISGLAQPEGLGIRAPKDDVGPTVRQLPPNLRQGPGNRRDKLGPWVPWSRQRLGNAYEQRPATYRGKGPAVLAQPEGLGTRAPKDRVGPTVRQLTPNLRWGPGNRRGKLGPWVPWSRLATSWQRIRAMSGNLQGQSPGSFPSPA